MFYILTILTIIMCCLVLYYKEYKSSFAIMYLFVITTFYTPAFYYVCLEETAYRQFNEYDLKEYMFWGSLVIFVVILALIVKGVMKKRISNKVTCEFKIMKVDQLAFSFSVGVICFVVGYCLFFFPRLPLIQVIRTGEAFSNSLARPDVSGNIPLWFTYSTIASIVLPMIYFYYREQKIWKSKMWNVFCLVLLCFFSSVGGNKAMAVYLLIFVWVYEWNCKVDGRIILSGISVIGLYYLIKAGKVYSGYDFFSALRGPAGRFFLSQGAMLINRIGMLNAGCKFDGKNISDEVYEFVYHEQGGGAPTFFMGDFMVRYGQWGGFLLGIVIFLFIFVLVSIIEMKRELPLYVKWGIYLVLYFLGMSSIGKNFWLRLITILGSIFVLALSKLRKESSQEEMKV